MEIHKGWGKLFYHIRLMVGDGISISFWQNLWYVDRALKEAFPKVFSIAQAKDTVVMNYTEIPSDSIMWNVTFVRVAYD